MYCTYCILRPRSRPWYWHKDDLRHCQVKFTSREANFALTCSIPYLLTEQTTCPLRRNCLNWTALCRDKGSALMCARSSFVQLVDEALHLGLQLPILVVQKPESLRAGGMGRGHLFDDSFCRLADGKKLVLAAQLPRWVQIGFRTR